MKGKLILTKHFRNLIPWRLVSYIPNLPFGDRSLKTISHKIFSYLKIVGLHINTECNYACKYCYIDKDVVPFTTKEWVKVIDEAEKLGVLGINFIGGEPFLHKDFSYLLHYTAKKGFHIGIFTNGSLIDDEWIREIKNLPTKVFLAIKYDYNSDTYEKHTGRGYLFSKVQDVIKKSTQAGIKVVTFTTLTKYNVEYVKEIIESSVELGAYPVFERYVPVNSKEIKKELEVDPKKYYKAMKLIQQSYSETEGIIRGKASFIGSLCNCYVGELSVTPDGFALPCAYAPKELSLGNLKEISLKEIWNRYKEYKKKWTLLPEECAGCKYRYICGGGCRTHTFYKYGDITYRDPLCKGFPPVYGQCGWCVMHLSISKIFK